MGNDNNKNFNKVVKIVEVILVILLGIGAIFGAFLSNNSESTEELLKIYYFNVGQADCTLIICEDETLLIDGGNEADSDNLINYMQNIIKISELNYVIATHTDGDHIGGLDKIIDTFDTQIVYMPYTEQTGKEVTELKDAAGDSLTVPNENDIFYVGDSQCTILHVGNLKDDDGNEIETSDNNTSIVIQLDYGNISCLFMGDSESDVEESIAWNDIDILKVAHHGSSSSTTLEFLNQVKPEYSIISVGNNPYGHPTDKVLSNLNTVNSTVYRTDVEGTIILTSDGIEYSFEFNNTVLDGN